MADADAFLDAIWANPADDLPRLVYADWLEERGQAAYGQFIRLQCAIARLPGNSPEATELWKQVQPVWRRLEDEWWPIAFQDAGPERTCAIEPTDFKRGFLGPDIPVEPSAFYLGYETWRYWYPGPLCTFWLSAGCGVWLASCPTVTRIRSLRLLPLDNAGLDGLADLVGLPAISNLAELDLTKFAPDRVNLETLVASPLRDGMKLLLTAASEYGYRHPASRLLSGGGDDDRPGWIVLADKLKARFDLRFHEQ